LQDRFDPEALGIIPELALAADKHGGPRPQELLRGTAGTTKAVSPDYKRFGVPGSAWTPSVVLGRGHAPGSLQVRTMLPEGLGAPNFFDVRSGGILRPRSPADMAQLLQLDDPVIAGLLWEQYLRNR
jgi:hypothetical protein